MECMEALIDGCGPSLEQTVMQELRSSLFLSHVLRLSLLNSYLPSGQCFSVCFICIFLLRPRTAEAFRCETQQGLFVCFLFRSDSLNVYYLQITGHTHINS